MVAQNYLRIPWEWGSFLTSRRHFLYLFLEWLGLSSFHASLFPPPNTEIPPGPVPLQRKWWLILINVSKVYVLWKVFLLSVLLSSPKQPRVPNYHFPALSTVLPPTPSKFVTALHTFLRFGCNVFTGFVCSSYFRLNYSPFKLCV